MADSERLVRSYYTSASALVRQVQVQCYKEFCRKFDRYLSPYPCTNRQVCLYIAYLSRRLSFSSIRNYLSALSIHLQLRGYGGVQYDNILIKHCLQGVRADTAFEPCRAKPLLPGSLVKLIECMPDKKQYNVIKAVMLLGFRTLLRIGHMVNTDLALKRRDFVFHTWGVMVYVHRSKNHRFRTVPHRIPITTVQNYKMCAVYWIRRHFCEYPASQSSNAFLVKSGGTYSRLDYYTFSHRFKVACAKAGLDPTQYSSHSLRRGGATFLAMCGWPLGSIKSLGEWRSNVVEQYIDLPMSRKKSMDRLVAQALGGCGI